MSEIIKDIDKTLIDLKLYIDRKFVEQRKELNQDYERHTGMVYEKMKENTEAALEQMRGLYHKKLDREEFYEFMARFETRIIRKLKPKHN